MITIRVISSTWLILVLVPLMIIGCQLGIGAQPAPTPPPQLRPCLQIHQYHLLQRYHEQLSDRCRELRR